MCGWKNGKRCRDGNPYMYCGVVSTLFGCFFVIPSLHGPSFFKMFFVTCYINSIQLTKKCPNCLSVLFHICDPLSKNPAQYHKITIFSIFAYLQAVIFRRPLARHE